MEKHLPKTINWHHHPETMPPPNRTKPQKRTLTLVKQRKKLRPKTAKGKKTSKGKEKLVSSEVTNTRKAKTSKKRCESPLQSTKSPKKKRVINTSSSKVFELTGFTSPEGYLRICEQIILDYSGSNMMIF